MDDSDVKVFGDHNYNVGNHHETNYHGMTHDELLKMLEERFQHTLKKEEQIEMIFEENRKLTDEVIRQNADFRLYNEAYRILQERNNTLTERVIELTEKLSKWQ